MTRAEETIREVFKNSFLDLEYLELKEQSMSIHAQEFAEFTSLNWWSYDPESKLWFGEGYPMKKLTTSELYTIFNNQNK